LLQTNKPTGGPVAGGARHSANRAVATVAAFSFRGFIFLPVPRLAGVTGARYLLWGANTPL